MNSEIAFIVGIGHDEQEYTVSGVRYTVASRYVPVDYHRDDQQTLSQCLRHYILRYFGEKTQNYCGNCSACKTNYEKKDISVEALKIAMPELVKQGYEFVTLTELFQRQGETPKGNMIYTTVAKYPCSGYSPYKNIFTGEAAGASSWSGWSDTAVLDGAELEKLGDSFAIEVKYSCPDPPVIALQKWSGTAVWQQVQPFYSNGDTACFLASDLQAALDSLDIGYTDLDRLTVTASSSQEMTVTSVDILVKGQSQETQCDVNSDGEFTIADLVAMQSFLLGNGQLKNWQAGDLCQNRRIEVFDLILMRERYLASSK